MKSCYKLALGLMAGGLLAGTASAQETGVEIFKVDAGSTLAYLANDNLSRGLAYNAATGNLLVCSRTGANTVHVVNAATGAAITPAFNATGITGGTLALMKVRVDGDGRIYANNLSGAAASTFKMYRWASEASGLAGDASTIVFERTAGTSFATRVGDAMDISGSGTSVRIVVMGSKPAVGAHPFVVLTDPENDGTFVDAEIEPATPFVVGIPNVAIDPVNSDIAWYKKSETTDDSLVIDFNVVTGADGPGNDQNTVIGVAADADNTTGGPIDVTEIAGVKYFSVGPSATATTSTEPLRAKIFAEDVDPAGYQTGPLQPAGGINANLNGSGDVILLPDGRLFVLASNNSLSAWQFTIPANVQDWNLYQD